MPHLKPPRRPAIRHHSDRESEFVTQLADEQHTIHKPGLCGTFGADLPASSLSGVDDGEDAMIAAMSEDELNAWLLKEHGFKPDHFMAAAYRKPRK